MPRSELVAVDLQYPCEDVAGAEELRLDGSQRKVQLLCNLIVAELFEVAQLNQAAVAGLQLGNHLPHAVYPLLLFEGLTGIQAVVRNLNFHRIPFRIGEAFVQSFQVVYRSQNGLSFVGLEVLTGIVVAFLALVTCGLGGFVVIPMASFFLQNVAYERGLLREARQPESDE